MRERQALRLRDLALRCLQANIDTAPINIRYQPAGGLRPHVLELFHANTSRRVFAIVWYDDLPVVVTDYEHGHWERNLRSRFNKKFNAPQV